MLCGNFVIIIIIKITIIIISATIIIIIGFLFYHTPLLLSPLNIRSNRWHLNRT